MRGLLAVHPHHRNPRVRLQNPSVPNSRTPEDSCGLESFAAGFWTLGKSKGWLPGSAQTTQNPF